MNSMELQTSFYERYSTGIPDLSVANEQFITEFVNAWNNHPKNKGKEGSILPSNFLNSEDYKERYKKGFSNTDRYRLNLSQNNNIFYKTIELLEDGAIYDPRLALYLTKNTQKSTWEIDYDDLQFQLNKHLQYITEAYGFNDTSNPFMRYLSVTRLFERVKRLFLRISSNELKMMRDPTLSPQEATVQERLNKILFGREFIPKFTCVGSLGLAYLIGYGDKLATLQNKLFNDYFNQYYIYNSEISPNTFKNAINLALFLNLDIPEAVRLTRIDTFCIRERLFHLLFSSNISNREKQISDFTLKLLSEVPSFLGRNSLSIYFEEEEVNRLLSSKPKSCSAELLEEIRERINNATESDPNVVFYNHYLATNGAPNKLFGKKVTIKNAREINSDFDDQMVFSIKEPKAPLKWDGYLFKGLNFTTDKGNGCVLPAFKIQKLIEEDRIIIVKN